MPSETCREKRSSAVRYWESRRLGFNLALVAPGVCGWLGYLSTVAGISELSALPPGAIILPVLAAIAAANLLYSAVYGLEFLLKDESEAGHRLQRGRDLTFTAGCIAVVGIAFLAGAGLAEHIAHAAS